MSSYHPFLPAGINSAAIDNDELNGAGVNSTIWPTYIDGSYIPSPLLSFPTFWDDVDVRVGHVNASLRVNHERLTLQVR